MNQDTQQDEKNGITTADGTPIEELILEHFGHKPIRHIIITKNGQIDRRLIRRRTNQ